MIDLIGEYEQHLRLQRRADSTVDLYITVLRRMDKQLPAGLLSAYREEIQEWIFSGPRKAATQQLYVTVVQGFTRWATDPDHEFRLDHDEAAKLPRISRTVPPPKPIPLDHIAGIRDGAHGHWVLLFDLALLGGMRCIEIARLDRTHIDVDETRLLGKGGRERAVPTHPAIWGHVRSLPPGPLAVDGAGRRLDRRQLSRAGRKVLHAMGFPYSMHQLRHTFATGAYESSGFDIRLVQELLGHSSVATTQRYVQVARGRKAAAVLSLPAPGGASR